MTSDFPFLTRSEFGNCIEEFERAYGAVVDVEVRKSRGSHTYLSIHKPLFLGQNNDDAVDSDIEDVEDADPAHLDTVCPTLEYGRIEYHVVYSASWRVPVLYVRVHTNAGVEMDCTRVTDMLVTDSKVRGAMDAVEFGGALGIQDHPELNEPFMYLHPCHTATLLRAVAPAHGVEIDQRNYISSWLSLTGAAVGLFLPSIPH
ncbi:E2-like conjugating enzyme atg10 [Coemansia sp. RSA 355]|nr:E2-like conjugating enzyme atg10 [Coemansia sp. RSA 522]KAJ2290476.1 E2-like conjugating enzyme atg10 [Coemansia sp. RSA 355]